jgi:TP901 family phage tail tape measure protein
MPTTGVELANAWVRLVPSFEGVQGEVAKAFVPATEAAGKEGDKAAKNFSGRLGKGLKIGAGVVAAGVVAGFAGLYKIGDTFDEVTDTIRVKTGATGKDLDGLTKIAKNVGKSVPADFSKIGPVVADLNARMGLSGKNLEKVSKQYLEAGRILGEEIDVKKTTAAFNAFGLKGADVSKGMDTLFQVSQATGVGFNDLAGTVQRAAPAMKNLGFSFKETASFAGTLDKAGLNSQAVLASMSKGLVTLAKDGEKPQDAFKRVTGEIQGFVKEGDTAAALNLAGKVFGTKGATQFVGALQSGKINMEDLGKATAGSSDTILQAGKDTADFAEKAKMLGNQAQVALEPLATAVFTAIGDALTFVMPALDAFGNWAKNNTPVLITIAGVIGGIVVVALATYAASAIVAAAATWTLVAPILAAAAPFIAIGLAIAALIVGIVLLVKNWDAVVAWLKGVWAGAVSWWNQTIADLGKRWNAAWAAIGAVIQAAIAAVRAVIMAGLTWVYNFIMLQINLVRAIWNTGWALIGSILSAAWAGIRAIVTTGAKWVTDLIQGGIGLARRTWDTGWSAIRTTASNVWTWIDQHVFAPFKRGIDLIAQGFDNGQKAIGVAMGKIRAGAAKPVNFVLDTVWNNGLRSFWNGTMDSLGLKNLKLPEAKLIKYATGGVLPGYTPGRDVHEFYSPTGGRLALSGGEAIMRPEFTRAVGGPAGVARLNSMARKGQAFKSGGVFSWAGNLAGDVWDNVKNVAGSVGDFIANPAKAVQTHVIDGIINPLLKGSDNNVFLKAAASLPVKMVKALIPRLTAPAGTGKGTKGMGWSKMWDAIHAAYPGLVMTSNYRSPGSNAAVGGAKGSYHTLGRALDLIPASMDTFNKIARMFPNASELIYTPAGNRQLRNGQPFAGWSSAVRAMHYNHIHLAMKNGGVLPGLARGGTVTGAGTTLVGENGPELLHLPKGAQVNPDFDEIDDLKGVTFNNYAPLGKSPAQALTEFSNRAKGL